MSSARWIGATAVALTVVTVALAGGHSSPRPATFQQANAAHAMQTIRDTARIGRAVAVADTMLGREHAAVHRMRALTARAGELGSRSDSVQVVVDSARSGADSAVALDVAYAMRTEEVSTLRAAAAVADTSLLLADVRSDSLAVALAVSESRAQRADSVLAIAERDDVGDSECRVMRLVPCPSRWALGWLLVMVVAALGVHR